MKKTSTLIALAFCAAGLYAQTPDNPAEITWDPAEVGVIYAADQDTYFETLRDGNGNPASNWAPANWGQTVVISNDECNDGASAIRIDGLDFLPLQFPGTVSLAQWRWLHIDVYPTADDQLCFKLQNWWPGESYVSQIYEVKGGEWNSIDIDMEDPTYFQWSEMKTNPETQEKYINKGVNVFQVAGEKLPNDYPHAPTIYMTNIIAHNEGGAGINNVAAENVINDGRIFNVMGIEVDENYRGLVIRNGKKYLQK